MEWSLFRRWQFIRHDAEAVIHITDCIFHARQQYMYKPGGCRIGRNSKWPPPNPALCITFDTGMAESSSRCQIYGFCRSRNPFLTLVVWFGVTLPFKGQGKSFKNTVETKQLICILSTRSLILELMASMGPWHLRNIYQPSCRVTVTSPSHPSWSIHHCSTSSV